MSGREEVWTDMLWDQALELAKDEDVMHVSGNGNDLDDSTQASVVVVLRDLPFDEAMGLVAYVHALVKRIPEPDEEPTVPGATPPPASNPPTQ